MLTTTQYSKSFEKFFFGLCQDVVQLEFLDKTTNFWQDKYFRKSKKGPQDWGQDFKILQICAKLKCHQSQIKQTHRLVYFYKVFFLFLSNFSLIFPLWRKEGNQELFNYVLSVIESVGGPWFCQEVLCIINYLEKQWITMKYRAYAVILGYVITWIPKRVRVSIQK